MRIKRYIGLILAVAAAVALCAWGMSRLDEDVDPALDLSAKSALVAEHLGIGRDRILSSSGGYDPDAGTYRYSFTAMVGGTVYSYAYENQDDLSPDTLVFLVIESEQDRFS